MNSLTRTLALLVFLAAATATLAQDPPPAPVADLSTPEATVRTFVAAINRGDYAAAGQCLVKPGQPAEVAELQKTFNGADPKLVITLEGLTSQTTGEKARVQARVKFTHPGPPQETVELVRVDEAWKIMPPADDEVIHQPEPPILTTFAVLITHPDILKGNRHQGPRASCLSNLRQLGTAVMMLVQDHDERYALRADRTKAALTPYLKSQAVFRCPAVTGGTPSYSFNPALQGISLSRVKVPHQTVMFYEGSKGVLAFRHNNQTNICYADGHVKAVTRAQAKSLRWKP